MKWNSVLAGAGVAAVMSLGSSAAIAEHTWETYHWARTSNSFTLQVINSTTSEWNYAFTESLIQWASSGSPVAFDIVSADESNRTRKRCKTENGQLRVCNAAYGFNGWLGLATIGIDANGHIDRGAAKVNDSYANYWTIAGEMNHVMCQEIGHLFGLGHTSVDGSSQSTCMDYSMDTDSQWPNAHDYELLAAIYQHTDSYDSYAGAGDGGGTSGGGDPTEPCNAPPGRGCNKMEPVVPMGVLVHRHDSHELWVAPRRDGGLWLHHVRLAPE